MASYPLRYSDFTHAGRKDTVHHAELPRSAVAANHVASQVFRTNSGGEDEQGIVEDVALERVLAIDFVGQGQAFLCPVFRHVGMQPAGDGLEHATADFLIERRTDCLDIHCQDLRRRAHTEGLVVHVAHSCASGRVG